MSLLREPRFDVLTPADAWRQAAELETPFGSYLRESAGQGFDESIAGRVVEEFNTPRLAPVERSPAGQSGIARGAMSMQARDTDRKAISQGEWRNSRWWRDGIPWQEGMTEPRAAALAASYDRRRWRDSLYERYRGGIAGRAAGLAAQLLGSAASPENYIPILGPAARAAAMARFGTVAGHVAVGAAEGAIGNLAVAPFVYDSLNARGEDLGAEDLAIDIGFGALLGGAFGGAGGMLARRRAMRETGRIQGVHAVVDALNAAHDANVRGVPVDVAPIVRQESARAVAARAAVERIVREADAAPAAVPPAPASRPAERAFTAAGRAVDVELEVVEADTLVASNTDDLAVNPAFPPELQPRDRTRAASADQIGQMAANLNPELLGRSATAADGAPIIGPDGVVESGNARVLALRRAYAQHPERSAAYRAFVESQGFSTEGMTAPVLVRRRRTELAPEERAAFAREANERTTAAMSPTERAMADAAALDDPTMGLMQGSDVQAAGNRAFVRAFIGKVASESDRGSLLTADGELAKSGTDRVRNALLAKAYGDADLVARLAEEPESGLGPLGTALADLAPRWARLRSAIAAGTAAPEGDGTAALMEAVRSVVASRDAGNPLHFALSQQDMFGGGLSLDGKAFLGSLLAFDRKGNSRLKGREKIAGQLGGYADAAERQPPGLDMFGEPPSRPWEIIDALGDYKVEMTAGEAVADLVRRLDAGASPASLRRHPAVVRAVEQMAAIEPTENLPGYGTPEFAASRRFVFGEEEVVGYDAAVERLYEDAKAFAGGPVRRDRRAIIVLGPPAAGKSTLAERLARENGAAIVDPDEAKKALPEYSGGIGANAVHEESSVLFDLVMEKAVQNGDNAVLPKVGAKPDSIRRIITTLREEGYAVTVVNMAVTDDEAFRRMLRRFVKTGRIINPAYVEAVDGNPTRTYIRLKEEGAADGFAEYDGMGRPGAPLPLNEASGTGRELGEPRSGGRPGLGEAGQEAGGEAQGETAAGTGTGSGPRAGQVAPAAQPLDPATETIPEPHPSIAAGASRVAPGGDELAELAADAGLETGADAAAELGPALDQLEALGVRVTAGDREALADADATVKAAEGWGEAYETLSTCVTRFA